MPSSRIVGAPANGYDERVARVAGTSVLSWKLFLTKKYGGGLYERVLASLPREDAGSLGGIVLPVNWYPTDAYIRALHASHELAGDPAFFEHFGSFAADFQISAFRKFILRFTSPTFFLDHAGRMWARSHDTGLWEVTGGPKHVTGKLRDFAVVDVDYCRVLVAWIHRASQLTGTRGQTTHPACRARGDDACVFEGSWE